MKKIYVKKFIVVLLVMVMLITALSVMAIPALANSSTVNYFTGLSGDMDDETLHNATNAVKGPDGSYSNEISGGAPQITVFVHGLGGSASHWSNDYTFTDDSLDLAYNGNSLVEKIRKLTNADVFLANDKTSYDDIKSNNAIVKEGMVITDDAETNGRKVVLSNLPSLCKCNDGVLNCSCIFPYSRDVLEEGVSKIDSISSHIVVVFQASNPTASNQRVYEELNYTIDKIVYDVKYLNDGVLPKINLIGHSRGGLTAMQYALEHPYLVDSLFTLGTPFEGSTLAYEPLLNLLEMSTDPNNTEYFSFGIKDVLDSEVYNEYRDQWNEGYEEKYSHINFHAIGSYATLEAIAKIIVDSSEIGLYLPHWADEAAQAGNVILDVQQLLGRGCLANHSSIILGDLFVNTTSQLASGYEGVQKYLRLFTEYSMDLDMRAQSNVPIPHNLEPGDFVIHNYILDNINLGVNFTYTFNPKHYKAYTTNGVFSYPAVINDVPTEEIPAFAFDGIDDITAVVIPATVKKIGHSAFANCPNLTSVTFAEGSQLEEIADEAFMGCSALTSIDLPESLKRIGSLSFAGTGLTSITLKANIESVNSLSFLDSKLTAYAVDGDCLKYQAIDGVLYTKNYSTAFVGESLISYPPCKPDSVYNMPTVAMGVDVSSYAFYNAKNLVEVGLGSHGSLSANMFDGCSSLTTINAPELFYVSVDALRGTALLNSGEETIVIGKTLIRYKGNAETYVISDDFYGIAPYAFEEAPNLKNVIIGPNFRVLCPFAFANCTKLENVYVDSFSTVTMDNGAFANVSDDLSIYVSSKLIEEYTTSVYWEEFRGFFKTYTTRIRFNTNGGNTIEDIVLPLHADLTDIPTPDRKGYAFVRWTYEYEGTVYESYGSVYTWQIMTPEITFEAEWDPILYCVTYNYNLSEEYLPEGLPQLDTFTVESSVELPTPIARGHVFNGWYTTTDFEGSSPINELVPGEETSIQLYASWSKMKYNITLEYEEEYVKIAPASNEITIEYEETGYNDKFAITVKPGYVIYEWYYVEESGNEKAVVSYDGGNAIDLGGWMVEGDVTVYARILPELYYIRIDGVTEDNLYQWFTENGIETTSEPIPSSESCGIECYTLTSTEEIARAFNLHNQVDGKYLSKFEVIKVNLERSGEDVTLDLDLLLNGNSINDLGEDGDVFIIRPIIENERYIIKKEVADSNGNVRETEIARLSYGEAIDFLGEFEKEYYRLLYLVEKGSNEPLIDTNQTVMPDLSPDIGCAETTVVLTGVYKRKTANYTLLNHNGNAIGYGVIELGPSNTPVKLSIPSRRGYKFNGWYTGSNGQGTRYTGADGTLVLEVQSENAITLYPYYTIETYTITYITIGNNSNPTTYTVNSSFDLTFSFKQYYTFMGWYDENGNLVERISDRTGNLVLTASFIENEYTVTFNNGGTTHTVKSAGGKKITVPDIKGGYIYVSGNERINAGESYTVTGNKSFSREEKNISECLVNGVYEIYTKNQLNSIHNISLSSSTYILLKAHITFDGVWKCIDNWSGTFDGDGYMISGLTIEKNSNSEVIGMFGTNVGTVRNLTVHGSTLTLSDTSGSASISAGIVVGLNKGTLEYVGTSSCTVSTTRSASSIGGMVGKNYLGNILYCTAQTIHISGCGDMGIIVGSSYGGTLYYNDVFGDDCIIRINGANRSIGGVVGYAYGGCSIRNCMIYSLDIIFDSYTGIDKKELKPCIGYLVGHLDGAGTSISNSSASGVTMTYGGLPSEFTSWFKKYNPREHVLAVASGAIGCVSNSATYSGITVS